MNHKCEFIRSTKGSTASLTPNKCKRPQFLECTICTKIITTRCKATREESCEYCARISKSRRVQQFTEALLPHKVHFQITATPPGADVYPWDKQYCTHPKHVRCEGPIGCRVSNAHANAWNSTFTERYNDFMTDLRRAYPHMDIQYGNVREVKR